MIILMYFMLFQLTYADIGGPKASDFLNEVRLAANEAPWFFNFTSEVSANYMDDNLL